MSPPTILARTRPIAAAYNRPLARLIFAGREDEDSGRSCSSPRSTQSSCAGDCLWLHTCTRLDIGLQVLTNVKLSDGRSNYFVAHSLGHLRGYSSMDICVGRGAFLGGDRYPPALANSRLAIAENERKSGRPLFSLPAVASTAIRRVHRDIDWTTFGW